MPPDIVLMRREELLDVIAINTGSCSNSPVSTDRCRPIRQASSSSLQPEYGLGREEGF